MRLKDILKEAAMAKKTFKRPPGTSLTEDKPKAAPSDDKLKNMGNKKSAEKAGHELTGVTRSLDKEKDFKLKKKDVDASKVTDGYGNDVDVDTANSHATEQRADAEVENLKESGERFKKLTKKLSGEKGIEDPKALAASIGRKKYGAKKFGQMAHHESVGIPRMAKLLARILPEAEEPEPTDNGEMNPPKQPPAQQSQGQEHQKSDSQAADQAHKLGLTAKPYGNWADDTGKVVAKTVKGNLVKLDPNEKRAKNASAPTDSGEFAPPSKSSEKPAEPQAEPSSKLKDLTPTPDYSSAEARMNAKREERKQQTQKLLQAVEHFGGAMNAIRDGKVKLPKGVWSSLADEGESILGNAYDEHYLDNDNISGVLLDKDWSEFDTISQYSDGSNFEPSEVSYAAYYDAATAAAADLENGQLPESNPETVKKYKIWRDEMETDVEKYKEDTEEQWREMNPATRRRPMRQWK